MYSIENNIRRISKRAREKSRPVLAFISVPMNGRSVNDIRKQVDEVKELLKKAFKNDIIEIVSPVGLSEGNTNVLSRLEMLGNSIGKMNEADVIIFADGWNEAPGCRVEKTVAYESKIPWIFEEDLKGLK